MPTDLRLGLSLTAYRGCTLVQALERACCLKDRIGLSSLELWMERHYEGDGSSLWPWEFDDHTIAAARPLLDQFPCKGAHLPFAFTNLAALNPRIREESVAEVELGLEVCHALRMDYGVTHARYGTLGLRSPAEEQDLFRQAFERLGARARGLGVAFTVENGDCLHCLDDLLAVVAPLEDLGVGITLDTGHANLPGGWGSFGSGGGFARARGQLVRNIHLHDNDGEDDRHWPPGQGNIDFAGLFTAFRQAGVSPVVTFEFAASDEAYARAATRVRAWWEA